MQPLDFFWHHLTQNASFFSHVSVTGKQRHRAHAFCKLLFDIRFLPLLSPSDVISTPEKNLHQPSLTLPRAQHKRTAVSPETTRACHICVCFRSSGEGRRRLVGSHRYSGCARGSYGNLRGDPLHQPQKGCHRAQRGEASTINLAKDIFDTKRAKCVLLWMYLEGLCAW